MLADPEVVRFSERGAMMPEATAEFIEWCEHFYRTKGFGPWALVTKDRAEFSICTGATWEVELRY